MLYYDGHVPEPIFYKFPEISNQLPGGNLYYTPVYVGVLFLLVSSKFLFHYAI